MPRLDSSSATTTERRHAGDCLFVARLLRSDSDAWREFVQSYGRLVRARVADVATSFGRGCDDTAVDDAVAEVFAAILNNDAAALRGYAGRSSLVTYLAVIATRSATRGFAAQTRSVGNENFEAETEALADPAAVEPIGKIILNERSERVHALLQRLPAKQREVVRLFHLESFSYQQISQIIDMPIGSIGPTLRRAEAKLKAWLES